MNPAPQKSCTGSVSGRTRLLLQVLHRTVTGHNTRDNGPGVHHGRQAVRAVGAAHNAARTEEVADGLTFLDASFMTHAVGVEWSPKVEGFVTFTAGAALTNLFDKEYRMLNGSYGYGRAARVWLSAQF